MELDLQGKIENFNLAEIFQLIASGKNSGTLGIQRDDSIVMIYFQDGEIIYGYGPNQTYHLGELLKENGNITESQLQETVSIQSKSENSRRLGEILISRGYIDRADLEKVITRQIESILFSLLSWESGTFKFYQDQFPTEEEITVSISVENMIMEGLRRVDEMKLVKDMLPHENMVLEISTTKKDRGRNVSLFSDEWNIMSLVNGQRTIRQIIAKSTIGKEETEVSISKLMISGIIKEADPSTRTESNEIGEMVNRLAGLFEDYLNESSSTDSSKSRLTTTILENSD